MLPFAFGSFGSFTTDTYKSFSPGPNATLVVPSPAAISNSRRSLPSGDNLNTLPPDHCATYKFPKWSTFMLSGPIHHDLTLSGARRLSLAKFER